MGTIDQNIVDSYNSQIWSIQNDISEYSAKIRTLENDIAELTGVKKYFTGMLEQLNGAVAKTKKRRSLFSTLTIIKNAVIRDSFFEKRMDDVISGTEYSSAVGSMENAISKVTKKIRATRDEIESLKGKIAACNASITNISSQKAAYISQATADE